MKTSLKDRLHHVWEQVERAASRSNRRREAIQLIAVSKLQPIELIREAIDAGQMLFGENYVQEAEKKHEALHSLDVTFRCDLIGHLQKNKAKTAVQLFDRIQSVDSLQLAERLSRFASERGASLPVLVQVNLSKEETKSGASSDQLPALISAIAALPAIDLQGLMMIGSYIEPTEPEQKRRGEFIALRELRDRLVKGTGQPLPHLSMGMSHDFELAIEEGATIVRVGSAIFGERPV